MPPETALSSLDSKEVTGRFLALPARLFFLLVFTLSSFYCVLAYIPDTYFAFIQAPFQVWMPLFARFHPLLCWGAVLILFVSLWLERGHRSSSGPECRWAISMVLGVIALTVTQPLSHVASNSRSMLLAYAFLLPILWLGVIDLGRYGPLRSTLQRLTLTRAMTLGWFVGTAFVVGGAFRNLWVIGGRRSIGISDWQAFVVEILTHVFFFACLAAIAWSIRSWGKGRVHAAAWQSIARLTLVGAALFIFFDRIVFPTIPFDTTESLVYSLLAAPTFTIFAAGSLRPSWRWKQSIVLRPGREKVLGLTALLLLAGIAPLYFVLDWNGVLERTFVVGFWVLSYLVFKRWWTPVEQEPRRWLRLKPAPLALLCFVMLQSVFLIPTLWGNTALRESIGKHSYDDSSFHLIYGVTNVFAQRWTTPCVGLCTFLVEQTNIGPSQQVGPVDLGLVDRLEATPRPKPNIFIVVFDSLRQDSVQPYSDRIATPEILRFANDSVVFRNAMTHYAGTTLAEPSIWVGGLMLHKHYIQPFSPMNNLEKLIKADGFDAHVSVDTTLRVLIDPKTPIERLEKTETKWTDLDFCGTEQELKGRIRTRPPNAKPMFVYTQPQNVHLITLKVKHPEVTTLSDLQTAYEGEVQHIDTCFGKFIGNLKSAGIYDNSIIVVTADHGERFGESGHSSHANSLYPEVIRVPLIVHLPKAMQGNYHYDSQAVVFNDEIAPSIYYLLGHRPIRHDEVMGRPLFTATEAEWRSYQQESYLLVSSYAPVYGLISRDGSSLFIANELARTNELYDLKKDPGAKQNIVDSKNVKPFEQQLRTKVEAVASAYHFRYHSPTLLDWLMQ